MFLKTIFKCNRVERCENNVFTDCSKTKLADNARDRYNNMISLDIPRVAIALCGTKKYNNVSERIRKHDIHRV